MMQRRKQPFFLISISQWDKYDIADEKITFSVREILSNKETYEGSISTLNLDKNSGSVKILLRIVFWVGVVQIVKSIWKIFRLSYLKEI